MKINLKITLILLEQLYQLIISENKLKQITINENLLKELQKINKILYKKQLKYINKFTNNLIEYGIIKKLIPYIIIQDDANKFIDIKIFDISSTFVFL